MNTITLLGRATTDIEVKATQAGKSVATFSLAVKRPFTKDTTDFFTIVAWDKQAELLGRYISKGNQLCIRGHLTNRNWTDKQGNKRVSTEVVADEVSFVGNNETATESKPSTYTPSAYSTAPSTFEEVPNDGDLPF